MTKLPRHAALMSTVAITLAACSPVAEPQPLLVSPSDPKVVEQRTTARQALTSRLDQTVKAARLSKEIGRSGLDRCRRGNDDMKNEEQFASKCTLSLYRAYAWDGKIEVLLDRLRDCPGVAKVRDYWRDSGGKRIQGNPAPWESPDRIYDVGDLPDLECDGVTMEFTTTAHLKDPGLESMLGATLWDPDGGMYGPYYWAPQGKPWLQAWSRHHSRYRFLVAMEASKGYALIRGG
ncbi:hypothetical protein ACFSKW_45280 [Nonomuraea mangrovi]|uniref:Lipoprotein n=1 Tax=Nonomuraea mangrovi TaxID=2316207 RepID=A0ABW4TAG7_9ACTN